MWTIKYYATPRGNELAIEFISGLNKKKEIPYVVETIKMLEKHGNKLDRPHRGYLAPNLYDLNIKTVYGEIRLIYFFNGNEIVITHGFRKKTRKTRPEEIEKGIRYRENYLERV